MSDIGSQLKKQNKIFKELFNSNGESSISYADYAIAFVDEIQNKKYLNQQITFCSK